ncbi:hypothetical protein NKH93_32950 [Mesorhizobium sp. M0954]|uniref:hypothetical protein n=1 Tax=Mesorhizobium sp. M0954 TaxID=2957032 RepID=UPI0033381F9A
MFSAIQTYLKDISTWLLLLKYLGLCLAAGSSIWGTVNQLTVAAQGGEKRLTSEGVVAISFTILGLLISLASEDLARRNSENTRKAQTLAETKRTNEIIIAGQPLTSLSLHWEFASMNAALSQAMKKGQEDIKENAESSQGGTPAVPFDVEEYSAALLPLISYVAGIGAKNGEVSNADQAEQGAQDSSFVVLVALDASPNAILSFGAIGSGVTWKSNSSARALSSGFLGFYGVREGNSTPRVTADLATMRDVGVSTYAIDWDLDPGTLASVIDRRNAAIPPTANLPKLLKVAIFHDIRVLPFEQHNFGVPHVDVWGKNELNHEKMSFEPNDFSNMILTMEVNNFSDMKYRYSLRSIYEVDLVDKFGDGIDSRCTMLEFEAT